MLVGREQFDEALAELAAAPRISLDTETTGLKVYHEDHLFCLVASTADKDFYFNFSRAHPEALDRKDIAKFAALSGDPAKLIFMANAKFDMAMLAREGVHDWAARVHDVLAVQRLITSDAPRVNLDAVAKYYEFVKSNLVEEYIKEHGLWDWVLIPGKKSREKAKHFDQVPFPIIYEYALKDARITFDIGVEQLARWESYASHWPPGLKANPLEIEYQTTKACFQLEQRGVLVDASLCETKDQEHTEKFKHAAREFADLTGSKLVDSANTLAPIFKAMGHELPKTDKGRDSITDQWLEQNPSRVASAVRTFRENTKLANTYYKAFLWHRDQASVIHADIRQGGTRTGRFSYGVPNLQNVPKNGAARQVFVPRPGHLLLSVDFQAQEYRLLLDYAQEREVIDQVLGGLDVHTATARMMGVERTPAKTLNFLLLYGGGVVKLAQSLYKLAHGEDVLWSAFWRWRNRPEKITCVVTPELQAEIEVHLEKAHALRELYFAKLPAVSSLIKRVITAAEKNRQIKTWTGRPIHFPNRNFCYKAPNALIQGGCSDVGKLALIELDRFCRDRKTKPIILVHDEIVFEVHESEVHLVPELKGIMESVYPYKRVPLTCSVAWSAKSWGDLKEGMPGASGDQIQEARPKGPTGLGAAALAHQDAGSGEERHA